MQRRLDRMYNGGISPYSKGLSSPANPSIHSCFVLVALIEIMSKCKRTHKGVVEGKSRERIEHMCMLIKSGLLQRMKNDKVTLVT